MYFYVYSFILYLHVIFTIISCILLLINKGKLHPIYV